MVDWFGIEISPGNLSADDLLGFIQNAVANFKRLYQSLYFIKGPVIIITLKV